MNSSRGPKNSSEGETYKKQHTLYSQDVFDSFYGDCPVDGVDDHHGVGSRGARSRSIGCEIACRTLRGCTRGGHLDCKRKDILEKAGLRVDADYSGAVMN